MDSWKLLLEVVVLLSGCLVLGALCSWLKQSPIVGYLTAGMILGGPGSLHLVQSERDIEAIAELGVALLLFSLGLEFSWRRLLSLGSSTLLSGAVQVVLTSILGTIVAYFWGLSLTEAVAVGAIVNGSRRHSTVCAPRWRFCEAHHCVCGTRMRFVDITLS